MNFEWLNTLLAGFIDKFKAKNPKVFAVVQTLLLTLQFFLISAQDADLFGGAEWVATVLKWLGLILMVLVGSRTTNILNAKKEGNTSQGG